MRKPTCIDFETHAIEPRPKWPPEPVGFAIQTPKMRKPRYWAWGHEAGENNCTKAEAKRVLKDAYRSADRLLFHNAPFDLDVADAHFDLPWPDWSKVEDTTLKAFLWDPNAQAVSLKPLAERDLDWPPEERDELRDWIMANVPEAKGKPKTWKGWGAYIWKAPAGLAGRYACGDVERTLGLDAEYTPYIIENDMWEAYCLERQVQPILGEMANLGVPVDLRRLRRETRRCEKNLIMIEEWIRKRLKSPDLELDKNADLADAMENAGSVEEWILTEKGNRSVAFENLKEVCLDEPLVHALEYRAKLSTFTHTFLQPWLYMAEQTGGYIHCNWNQVRQAHERTRGRALGTRTGRLSSNPNFMNIPRAPVPVCFEAREVKAWLAEGVIPIRLVKQLLKVQSAKEWQLPNLRDFIIADDGATVLVRDYNQQELRILAHFMGGSMAQAYRENPKMDFHSYAQMLINSALGTAYARKHIKNTGFGIIYGASIGKTASMTGSTYDETQTLRRAYRAKLDGLRELEQELRRRGQHDEPIRTWGGRLYYCEEPVIINGRRRTFEYKLLNTLIQGSAADCTKRAMVNYNELRGPDARLTLQVHDELVGSTPKKTEKKEMARMREAMEAVEFEVPMLSDGKAGKSWQSSKGVDW